MSAVDEEGGFVQNKTSIFGGQVPGVRALSIGNKKADNFKLYDINKQDPSEVYKYVDFLKVHYKLYKAIFQKYSN